MQEQIRRFYVYYIVKGISKVFLGSTSARSKYEASEKIHTNVINAGAKNSYPDRTRFKAYKRKLHEIRRAI